MREGARFCLVATIDDRPRPFVLRPGRQLLGSARDCFLRFDLPGISRRHALLELDDECLTLSDLESKNGTLVNGRPITRAALEVDDEIDICGLRLIVERRSPERAALALALGRPHDLEAASVDEQSETTTMPRSRAATPGSPRARAGDAVDDEAGDEVGDAMPRLRFPSGYVRGPSAAMRAVEAQLRRLARGDLPVLILGATGVGKELIAHTLHASSHRGGGPLVAINCAAVPAELLEAELFGIERGIATGVVARAGRVAEAEGGTLFLDEIGEMPAPLQAKLLRMLQERRVQPLGGAARPVDVRIVAATQVGLAAAIEQGTFRRDLYYRLAGFVLEVPPLTERRDDLPGLIERFLRAAADELGTTVQGVTLDAMRVLLTYSWPGNVRQLEHEMRRLVYLAHPGQAIDASLLSPEILAEARQPRLGEGDPEPEARRATLVLPTLDLESLERMAIEAALASSDGTLIDAARRLGLTRDSLRRRLVRHGLRGG